MGADPAAGERRGARRLLRVARRLPMGPRLGAPLATHRGTWRGGGGRTPNAPRIIFRFQLIGSGGVRLAGEVRSWQKHRTQAPCQLRKLVGGNKQVDPSGRASESEWQSEWQEPVAEPVTETVANQGSRDASMDRVD
jgi:hypothetical protein